MFKKLCQKAFPKSLWVYHCNVGACNGCDIEVIDVLTPYYDAERFGIKLVGSPRHADVLLVCGPVTRQVVPALKRLYDAVPEQATSPGGSQGSDPDPGGGTPPVGIPDVASVAPAGRMAGEP